MTATCREACCSVTPRLTISELLDRGFRRHRSAPLAIEGAPCAGPEGLTARFSLALADGRIAAVSFRASTCATLIAFCEYLAEVAPGLRLDLAGDLSAHDLVAALPGVPPLKRDRAMLAVAAFRAAIAAAQAMHHKELAP
jgi:NifU-like N terminal domain